MPAIGAQKTIHQRNKSSPALSTMANGGGLKAAAKRTAFGDVSNTANTLRPSKDDLVIGNKGQREGTEKLAPLQQEKKATALSKPAQRPLTIAGLKGLLTSTTHISAPARVPAPAPVPVAAQVPEEIKQPLAEVLQAALPVCQAANTRKALTSRNTTVFKDQVTAIDEKLVLDARKPQPSIIPQAPVHSKLLPHSSQHPHAEEPVPPLRRAASKATVRLQSEDEAVVPPLLPQSNTEPAILRSDGVYIDDNGHIQLYQFEEDQEDLQETHQKLNEGVAVPTRIEGKSNFQSPEKLKEQYVPQPRPLQDRNHDVTTVSEPEEYWDDDEDNYDEEGYVTARSYRSRGENTTSGATTVLFPKMNLKTKKELAAAKALMEAAKAANEVDDETWDTTMVAEYGDEIFQYMRELENKMLPNAHYMDNQAEIQWSMRSVLMDWLVQVHQRFGLLPETLFLCCNYIDRFLSCKIVSLGKLQLVGATAIFVAAKYEEINCPSVQEIVYMVDNGYTVDEILKAERFMLSMLQFELGWPGPMSFLRRISKADDYDLETRTVAKYFLELTIMDERFVGSPPSFLAAGAHCLARMMLKKGHWSIEHIYFSNYTYTQLHSLVSLMLDCCLHPHQHHNAIFEKYGDKRYKRASHFVQAELDRGFTPLDVGSDHPAAFANGYDERQFCSY
ncbi:MAG: hypothetical protein Q9195_009245 [Heterodermia aff. obscurata]